MDWILYFEASNLTTCAEVFLEKVSLPKFLMTIACDLRWHFSTKYQLSRTRLPISHHVENFKGAEWKVTKAKIDPTSRLTNKIQKKLYKLRKENKFTNKTYFELYQFHHVYMAKSKHINRKKLSHASHCIHNRYAALWNIKISCRYHSADTQQKPTQSKKLKIICFASSNMENWTRWNTSFIWCQKPLSINTHPN